MKKKLYEKPQTESIAFQMATALCLEVSLGGGGGGGGIATMPRRGDIIQ